jgi:hypothetical protein
VRFDTCSYELSIHAPAEEIDICRNGCLLRPARNIAGEEAGMPDGKRISITIEIERSTAGIGPGMMVERWIEDIGEKRRCRVSSAVREFAQREGAGVRLPWTCPASRWLTG